MGSNVLKLGNLIGKRVLIDGTIQNLFVNNGLVYYRFKTLCVYLGKTTESVSEVMEKKSIRIELPRLEG